MVKIALIGAGGKMGTRITDNLLNTDFKVAHVEVSLEGRGRLTERGLSAVEAPEALDGADVVILAVPDNRIKQVSTKLEGEFRAGMMIVVLDAAAPFADHLPKRDDLVYFVTHPCHPPIYNDEADLEARRDFFGGVKAKQHIVCALMQGPESAYALGEKVARAIYAPVMRSHRVTVDQMAILEPVLSETVGATCITIVREAMDEAIRRGVPAEAARDFILGHLNVEIAIVFNELKNGMFSDGAKKAIEKAKADIFQPDWKKVFEPAAVAQSIRDITQH
jgi:D-apionate oxidoisomerase